MKPPFTQPALARLLVAVSLMFLFAASCASAEPVAAVVANPETTATDTPASTTADAPADTQAIDVTGMALTVFVRTSTGDTTQRFDVSYLDDPGEKVSLSDGEHVVFDGFAPDDYAGFQLDVPAGWSALGVSCTGAEAFTPFTEPNVVTTVQFTTTDITCDAVVQPGAPVQGLLVLSDAPTAPADQLFTYSGPIENATVINGEPAVLATGDGWVTIEQTPIDGLRLAAVTCQDTENALDINYEVEPESGLLRIDMPATGEVWCTFSSEQAEPAPADTAANEADADTAAASTTATLTLRKEVVGGNHGGRTFIMYSNGFADQSVIVDQPITLEIAPGGLNIGEEARSGWLAADITCTGVDALDQAPGAAFASFEAVAGATIECTSVSVAASGVEVRFTGVVEGANQTDTQISFVDTVSGATGAFGHNSDATLRVDGGSMQLDGKVTNGYIISDITCTHGIPWLISNQPGTWWYEMTTGDLGTNLIDCTVTATKPA